MGLPVSDDIDGRVLTSMLSVTRPVEYERDGRAGTGDEKELSAEEAAEVEERLRSLGYLG
jgi:hypothetical protein